MITMNFLLGDPALDYLPNYSSFQDMKRDPLGALFCNPFMSDITFVVGSLRCKFPGHRLILFLSNTSFAVKLATEWRDVTEIVIEDMETSPFLTFLRFLYRGEVVVRPEYLHYFFLMSNLYGQSFLQKLSSDIQFLQLYQDNFCKITHNLISWYARHGSRNEEEALLTYLKKNMNTFILMKDFDDLNEDFLKRLLDDDDLNVKELDLFLACVKWARKRCFERGLACFAQNLRQAMKPFIDKIRFPTMTLAEFNCGPLESGILKESEEIAILLSIKTGSEVSMKFSAVKRRIPITCPREDSNQFLERKFQSISRRKVPITFPNKESLLVAKTLELPCHVLNDIAHQHCDQHTVRYTE